MPTDYTEPWAVTRTRQRWKVANNINGVLKIGARRCWESIRHWNRAGIDLRALAEGEDEAVIAAAMVVLADLDDNPPEPREKGPYVSPVKRSAATAINKMEREFNQADTTRERTQIMLWAIGKCTTVEKAKGAFKCALAAIETLSQEAKHAESPRGRAPTDHSDLHDDQTQDRRNTPPA